MANKIINIPDLGEAEDVEVIEVCAKAGDHVDSEDPIIVLESDKAAMEIPASVIGKVISIEVSVGDKVTSGLPFLQIEASNDVEKQVENDSFDVPVNATCSSFSSMNIPILSENASAIRSEFGTAIFTSI